MHNEDSSHTSISQEFLLGYPSTYNSSHNVNSEAKTLSVNPSTAILKQPLCAATRTDGWNDETDRMEPIDNNLLSSSLQSFTRTSLNVTSCIDSLKSILSKGITNEKRKDRELFCNSEACYDFVSALSETTSSRYESVVTWSAPTLKRLYGNPATGTLNLHEITSKYVSNNTDSFEKCMPFLQPQINSASFLNNCASAGLDQTSNISSTSTNTLFSFFSSKPVGQWSCTNFCSSQSHIASSLASVTNIISSNSALLPPIFTGKQLPCLDSMTSTVKISSSVNLATSDVMPSDVASKIHQLYRCMECNKTFSTPHHLLNHLRVHSGERPYKCKDCTSCFTQAGSLKVHMDSVHAGQKKHKCSICSWTFARMSHLKRHELRHSKEKPYRLCHLFVYYFICYLNERIENKEI